MMTQDLLTDAVLYIYALSLLFFVSDAASGNRSARKVGTGLLVFVWVIQTAFLLYILIESLSDPKLTIREFLFYVSWLLVSASFVLLRWLRADLLVLLVNVVGFAVLALNLLEYPGRRMELGTEEVARRLLVVHISFITLAFAVLTVTALLYGMYLYLHRRLKTKRWSPVMSRMPGLQLIDTYAFRSGLIGVPLLLLSLSTGTAALLLSANGGELLDLKALLAYAAGAAYIVSLIRSRLAREAGGESAKWSLIGYALMVADFFASAFSSFHHMF
ncbi:cytochrome c biogenesis protein CcsA [Cohnella panacarvi]|uniref:cytochrome c biogenesis protein CcsA n=1 Tax=Cohnella panacarvi TaxID=400776 RepID=UPI0004798951|nr:cytochrome c biogenesis protein CcsA [Cohnella panacarvi]